MNETEKNYSVVEYNGDYYGKQSIREFMGKIRRKAIEIIDNGLTPVILSLPPIDMSRWMDDYTPYLWHEAANMELCRLAHENGFPFIDITTPIICKGKVSDFLADDGIRLNENGNKLVSELICSKLALR